MRKYKAVVNGLKEPLEFEAILQKREDQETYFFDDKGNVALCVSNYNLVCWWVEDEEEEAKIEVDENVYYLIIMKNGVYHMFHNIALERKSDRIILKKVGLQDIDCAKFFNEDIAYMFEIDIKNETIIPVFKANRYGL